MVVRARPDYYVARGSLLAARHRDPRRSASASCWPGWSGCERLLAAEGLFAPSASGRCRSCRPSVGLVTGRASAAERDVLENARRRWPAVGSGCENAPCRGRPRCRRSSRRCSRLDADPEVDVIVVARGGGSVEDLLPFSDEALVRAVAALPDAGGERDRPRAGHAAARPGRRRPRRRRRPTPRKRVVPDVAEELARVDTACGSRAAGCSAPGWSRGAGRAGGAAPPAGAGRRVTHALDVSLSTVDGLRTGPGGRCGHRLDAAEADLDHSRARVAALSPAATLQRGYAVVQQARRHGRAGPGRRADGDRAAGPGGRRPARRASPGDRPEPERDRP